MPTRSHAEPVHPPGRREPGDVDRANDGTRRPLAQLIEQLLQVVARTLRDAADGAIRLVRDPAGDRQRPGDRRHVPPEADTLDATTDDGLEPDRHVTVPGHG